MIQKMITWCHLTWLYHGNFWEALCGLTVFLDVEVPLHLQLVALAPCHGTAGTLSDWVIQVVGWPFMRQPLQLLWHILHLLKHHSQKSERNIGQISVKYISKIINIIHMYQLKYQSQISVFKKNQSQISITNISQISVKKYNFAPLQRSYVNESHLQKTSDKKNWHYCSYFSHNSYFSEETFCWRGSSFLWYNTFFLLQIYDKLL